MTIGKGTKQSNSEEWHTPKALFKMCCILADIRPKLDVAATSRNHFCQYYFTKEDDALKKDWLIKAGTKKTGIWCNAPGKQVQKFVNRATQQWLDHNLNIIMLIPVNTITNGGFENVWNLFQNRYIDIIPLFGIRPKFLLEGKEQKWQSRNGYILLVFRKR